MITYKEYCKTIKEDWGKTSPIPKEVYDFPDPLKGINWIDLGLPSGTLWADNNVSSPLDGSPYWKFTDLVENDCTLFVPTREQFQELAEACRWTWDDTRKGMVVTGKNGNNIFLPAGGYDGLDGLSESGVLGAYWSSEAYGQASAHCLIFDKDGVKDYGRGFFRWVGLYVRFVKNKNKYYDNI